MFPPRSLLFLALAASDDPVRDRLVARAAAELRHRYDLGAPRLLVGRPAIDPAVLGRPDVALAARAPPPAAVPRDPGAWMLGHLLATGVGAAASPYEIIGPDCGFGYGAGLSWADRGLPGGIDPTENCPWGDREVRVPKGTPRPDAGWPMRR